MGIKQCRKQCKEIAEWKRITEKLKPTVGCNASKRRRQQLLTRGCSPQILRTEKLCPSLRSEFFTQATLNSNNTNRHVALNIQIHTKV
jgi:hypothetical protein